MKMGLNPLSGQNYKIFHVTSLPSGKCKILFCRLLIFFSKSSFLKNSFRNTIRVPNSLDPDQTRQLQKLSADDTNRQRVKQKLSLMVIS